MDKIDLAKRIRERALLTGRFTLRSGLTSLIYWDKYRFESDPRLLSAITEALVELVPVSCERLAGLELGGIPLATALSLRIGKPCLFVRKTAKEYGTCNLVEGDFRSGDIAVVVEDVVTSGGQVVESVKRMRELGLAVQDAICVIDREQGGKDNLASIGCSLASLFTMAEIERLTATES